MSDTVLAAAPIIAVLVFMVGLGWSAVRAGLVAAVGTVVIALTAFDFAGGDDTFGPVAGVAGLLAEAAWVTLTVVAIIGPALAVYELQQRTNATDVLQTGLSRLTPDPRVAALLIAWFFSLFLEGAAGFGTPIALAAPFLVAAGFQPVAAVSAALVGHAAGVSFGAVGTPVLAQVAATEFTGAELARATAPYHTILGWILTAVVVVLIGRAVPGASPPWRWGAVAAGTFFVPYFLIGRFVGPELPTLGGALIGAMVFIAVVLAVRRRESGTAAPSDAAPADDSDVAGERSSPGELLRAGAPYLAIVALVLVTRLVPPVRDPLFEVEVDWRIFDDFTGSVRPLYHPGLLLPIAFAIGALAQGAAGERCARRDRDDESAARARRRGAAGDGDDRSGDVAVGHDRRTGGERRRRGERMAPARSCRGGTRHVRHRLGDGLQHLVHRLPGHHRGGDRSAGAAAARRAGIRCGGRQHHLPAQHRRGCRHGRPVRPGGPGPSPDLARGVGLRRARRRARLVGDAVRRAVRSARWQPKMRWPSSGNRPTDASSGSLVGGAACLANMEVGLPVRAGYSASPTRGPR
jgi:lactate permease